MEESLKENETTAEPVELPAVQPAARHKKHSIGGLLRDMWPAYLIEVIVIILGISITLALEQWRDNTKEEKLENAYQKNLLADIEVDLGSLAVASTKTQMILDQGHELLAAIQDSSRKPMTAELLHAHVRALLERPKFQTSDATFSDLKSSGNLHLIKDIQLKNLLFLYYNQAQNIRDVQDAEQQATIMLAGSYFLKHFPLNKSGPVSVSGLENVKNSFKNIEFVNNVLLRVSNRTELLDLYLRADSTAEKLRTVITGDSGNR